jgi:nucleotide-binding universal stress UspA family protein
MQDILVYTDNFRRPWTPAIEYAGRLAAAHEATLTAAYVYPSPLYTAPRYSAPSLIEAIWRNARELEAEAAAARVPFAEWAARIGVRRATWHVAEGYLPEALAEIGAWHDVLVLDRDDDETWGSASDVATLVLASQLPRIAVPKAGRDAGFDRVVIGWNGAPEAVRAVHAALPLLVRAKEVVLLRGEPRNSSLDISWKPPFEIDEHLKRHGIAFAARDLGADDEHAGEALLAAAKTMGADLLVMGAYGRSRFSEWALGGATRQVLNHAHLPVFMRH